MFEKQQQILMQSTLSGQQDQPTPTVSSAMQQHLASTLPTLLQPSAGLSDISEVERQRAVNTQLQLQIAENIRRQEEMVQRLQGAGQGRSSFEGAQGAAANAGNGIPANQGTPIQQVLSTRNNSMAQNDTNPFNNFSTNNIMGMQRAVSSGPGIPEASSFNQGNQLNNHNNNTHNPLIRQQSNPNPTTSLQQQQLFNLTQAMGLGNSDMMAQGFDLRQQAIQDALMQQNRLLQFQMYQSSLSGAGGSNNNDGLNASQMQQLLAMQAMHAGESAQQLRSSFSSSIASQPFGNSNNFFNVQMFNQGDNDNDDNNNSSSNSGNNNAAATDGVSSGGNTNNNPNGNGSNNDGDDDHSPLSPGSFRW